MDVNLFIPVDVKVKNVLSDSYTITWDLTAAAFADLIGATSTPALIIYGRDAVTTLVETLGTIPADATTFEFAVKSGISEVYLTAMLGAVETVPSMSVSLVSTNIMPEQLATAIGRDENGIARSIATTEDGVVKVTGVEVNNYGGDASAANQATTNAKLDGVIAATNAVKTATDSVTNQLGNVTLGTTTINALQNMTVTNFPANYPDVDTTAAVDALKVIAATETTLNTVALNTANGLKSTDLSLSGGVLDVAATNMPTDFPDSAVLAELSLQRVTLEEIANNVIDVETEVTAGNVLLTQNAASVDNIDTTTADMKLDTALIVASNTTVANNTLATKLSNDANGVKLDVLAATNAQLVKTADLALTAGVLSVTESNPITEFPDTAAHVLLNNIDTSIQAINTAHAITFDESLPAGTNAIGSVVVTASALPTGAATEATLAQVSQLVSSNNSIASNSRVVLANISGLLTAMSGQMGEGHQHVVLDDVITIGACANYRPEAVADPVNLERYSKYILQVFTYATQCKISLYRESALNNTSYYHKIPTVQAVSLFKESVFEHELPIARNLMVKIEGAGIYTIRITGFE